MLRVAPFVFLLVLAIGSGVGLDADAAAARLPFAASEQPRHRRGDGQRQGPHARRERPRRGSGGDSGRTLRRDRLEPRSCGASSRVGRGLQERVRVIDAGGRTVIPGLIDSHVHALMVAAAEAKQPFAGLSSIAEIQDWIRKEAARVPAGTWIWSPRIFPTRVREHRFPTREELDAAAPDHPVAIDGAYAWMVNSAALRAANITSATPNPPGGAIVKDASGQPTGLLRNVGALLSRFRGAADDTVPLEMLDRVHEAYSAAPASRA